MDKKVVLITGASSGFGFLTAEQLLKSGEWSVYAAARRVEKMSELESLGAVVLKMDVTNGSDVTEGVERIIREQGRIDALLANAGYGSYGMIEEVPMEEIERQFQVNLFGVARQIKAVLPHMRKQRSGRIVVTGSVVSNISTMGLGWYASTKHAVKAMATALRQEVRDFGISVSRIEPGVVKTGFDSIALDSLLKVDHHRDYSPFVRGAHKLLSGLYADCPGPESTVKAMVHALTTKRPKRVYRTTFDSRLLPFFVNTLPQRLVDALILLGVKRG